MVKVTEEHRAVIGSFCGRLDQHLMRRFGYKTAPSHRHPSGPMVDANRKKFDLYFRLFEDRSELWGGKVLVISRIGFMEVRKGHGSSLLCLITSFAQEHNYELIGIEMAATPSIQAFAAKYGFRKIDDNDNYTVPVSTLSANLKAVVAS